MPIYAEMHGLRQVPSIIRYFITQSKFHFTTVVNIIYSHCSITEHHTYTIIQLVLPDSAIFNKQIGRDLCLYSLVHAVHEVDTARVYARYISHRLSNPAHQTICSCVIAIITHAQIK